jgi:glycosyltransferase involved in cell wall biosynthesis
LRIAIVTEFFPKSEKVEIRGGVEARAFHVAKQLAKTHDVTVITTREHGARKKDEFLGFEVLRLGRERRYSQKGSLIERLSFVMEGGKITGKFDVVDGYNFVSYPVAWEIAQRNGAPSIATYHEVWLGKWIENIGVGGVLGELLERYVLGRNWDKFIAVSRFTGEKLRERGISGRKIEVIPNGIEIREYQKTKVEKFSLPTICCISRLVEYKHVGDLLKAIAIVRKDIPDVACKIIGSGPEEKHLKSLAIRLGLQKNVEFLGFVEEHKEVVKILKASHVFCLPSVVEGFGMVLLEAMASQVPYVASEIEPLVEATDRKGGLFFKPRDCRDLADKLLQMLKDRNMRKKCIKEGSRHVLNYEWSSIVKRIEEVYKSCQR